MSGNGSDGAALYTQAQVDVLIRAALNGDGRCRLCGKPITPAGEDAPANADVKAHAKCCARGRCA